MKKRSRMLLTLNVISFCIVLFCLVMFLLKIDAINRLIGLVLSLICFVLIFLCFIYVYKEEKNELVNFDADDYKFLVFDRDYSQDLRMLMDKTPISNTEEEAKLLEKYEEIAVDYERTHSCYIVYLKEEPVALIKVIRNIKNKEISFNVESSKEDCSKLLEIIANKYESNIK